MKSKRIIRVRDVVPALVGSILLMGTCSSANALGPVDVPPTWGGDWSSRQRLSGDWGGVRDDLGKKGVVLDADMFLDPAGVVAGGRGFVRPPGVACAVAERVLRVHGQAVH